MIMSQGPRDMKHTDMNFMNLNISLAISMAKDLTVSMLLPLFLLTQRAQDILSGEEGLGPGSGLARLLT